MVASEKKSRKTFSLLALNGDSKNASFHEVDGEWIDALTGIEAFIWSDQDEDIEGLNGQFDVFHVVEGRSGLCIGRGLFKEEAIESAKTNTRSRGRKNLDNAIKKTIDDYGLSPAYRLKL